MRRTFLCFLGLLVAVTIVVTSLSPDTFAQDRCKQWAGRVVSIQGTVQIRMAGETQWQPAKLNSTYCPGDTIRVLDKSRADVALVNQPVLRLDQNTTLVLKGMKEEKTSVVEMIKGAAHFFSRAPKNLDVNTAFVNAGIEGTEFFVRVDDDKTFISVFEGKVLASNEAGKVAITTGQSAVAEKGKGPELRVVVKPRDAVQWTLYYPPVFYYRPADFKALPEMNQATIQKSAEAYMKGDFTEAFQSIDGVPEKVRDARLFNYRASLLLAVGRVNEAKADIDKALSIAPNNSDALALQSVIAVTQNDKGKALDLARRAVEADPKSASARIALSYAQQANFNLEGARASLQEAVKLAPDNALAWARLAEVWLMFGELNKALEAAQKAVSLNPNLSRPQTVLGFAYLTQVKTKKSKEAFQKAIELDQADPMPRLGLGLAKIREGGWPKWEPEFLKMVDKGLLEGTRELEIAASLDPDNSIIRSYLGKAYYEETRDKLATDQFEMAKKLDPSDPTPHFYDAIQKQTTNRPVEALQDLEKAIELNDNRAVYRSKLLLDADLAARAASQARIYSDLGFQQRALVEGWKSVNTDPSDFSGHRFLADTYSVLPRHEIARVSELLVSQLLQPLNMTPIQPRLAESNLFLINSEGPANLSFNEFNPLFNRNGVRFQGGFLGGERGTFGGDAILSGIYNRASFSVGFNSFDTDGWRQNSDQKDRIANVFLQYELLPQTSIQGEYRYRKNERGDTALRFFEDDFAPGLRQEEKGNTWRLGIRHSFSPSSTLIGNFSYQSLDSGLDLFQSIDGSDIGFPPPPINNVIKDTIDSSSWNGELQYLFRSKPVNIVAGAGFFKIDSDDIFGQRFTWPGETPPLVLFESSERDKSDIKHTNLYLYSYINILKNVTFTVGASGDFFDEKVKHHDDLSHTENEFNPKFGVTWNPLQGTTLRGAVFRTFKRTLITDQTLEPTQVAGFNQFFDDPNATKTWVYGVGVDQKFSTNIYGGVEFSKRDLDVPFFTQPVFPGPFERFVVDWSEYVGRAYLYWSPYKWFALRAEYLYENFQRDRENTFGIRKVKSHRVPLGINFFHPSGFSAGLKATYYNQKGEFERQDAFPGEFTSGSDDFWLIDAAINYRLPKRNGFVTVGVTNLFDRKFNFVDTDILNPQILPRRFVYCKITLALP